MTDPRGTLLNLGSPWKCHFPEVTLAPSTKYITSRSRPDNKSDSDVSCSRGLLSHRRTEKRETAPSIQTPYRRNDMFSLGHLRLRWLCDDSRGWCTTQSEWGQPLVWQCNSKENRYQESNCEFLRSDTVDNQLCQRRGKRLCRIGSLIPSHAESGAIDHIPGKFRTYGGGPIERNSHHFY